MTKHNGKENQGVDTGIRIMYDVSFPTKEDAQNFLNEIEPYIIMNEIMGDDTSEI